MSDHIGIDFSSSGSVMTTKQLEEQRRKRGECLTCGQKCFQKKLFKSIPLTVHGQVLNGRCLKCNPLDVKSDKQVLPAVSRPATRQDMERFQRSRSSLRIGLGAGGGGVPPPMRRGPSVSGQMSRGPSMASIGEQSRSPPPIRRTNSVVSTSSTSGREESATVRSTRSFHEGSRSSRGDSSSVRSIGSTSRPAVVQPGVAQPSNSPGAPPGRSSSINGRRIRRGESTRSVESTRSSSSVPFSGNQQTPPPVAAHVESSQADVRPPSRTSSLNRQSPGSGSASPNPSPGGRAAAAPGAQVSDSPENQGLDIHRAVLGGMAAQYLADRFRSRKAAERAQESAIEAEGAFGHDRLGTGSAHSAESWKTDEEEYDAPVHGILNRGGEFSFDQTPHQDDGHTAPFSSMNAESNRTMSSMSSIEEEPNSNGHHQKSWKPAAEFAQKKPAAPAVFEAEDEASASGSYDRRSFASETRSTRSSRSGQRRRAGPGSVNRHFQKQEERALGKIENARGSYVDILGIMADMPHSALVQQEGLKDLSNLHLSNAEYGHLAELGALDRVVEAMNSHPHSSEVQVSGCRAIWNLSATTNNQEKLVVAGALDAIITAMAGFPDDCEVQEKAMAALSNLGAAERNQRLIMEKGTVGKIVEAMNRHSEDGAVQAKACSAITNFASYDSPLKLKIMESGGGGAVVIAMIMHPEDVDLQEKALRALRNICANSEGNKIEVANVGGIDAVISAMQVHRDEPGVQEAGAWTLSNLAVNPDNKAVIGDSGGIDVVVRAMWVHSDNVGVQEWCCRALWTLSVDAQNRQVMMEVGGISAVVNAMQAHADAATVQEKGCGVLSNLAASDDTSKIRIVDEEALDAIIMAMVLHADNAQVQDRACSVIKRLAIEPNVKAMQAANIGELVKEASKRFPDRCHEKARAILAVL